jgi:hypothetical protein
MTTDLREDQDGGDRLEAFAWRAFFREVLRANIREILRDRGLHEAADELDAPRTLH